MRSIETGNFDSGERRPFSRRVNFEEVIPQIEHDLGDAYEPLKRILEEVIRNTRPAYDLNNRRLLYELGPTATAELEHLLWEDNARRLRIVGAYIYTQIGQTQPTASAPSPEGQPLDLQSLLSYRRPSDRETDELGRGTLSFFSEFRTRIRTERSQTPRPTLLSLAIKYNASPPTIWFLLEQTGQVEGPTKPSEATLSIDQLYPAILDAWNVVYEKARTEALTVESYVRVLRLVESKFGRHRLPTDIRATAFLWSQDENEEIQAMGKTVLAYLMIKPALAGIRRLQRNYPEAFLDSDDLFEYATVWTANFLQELSKQTAQAEPEAFHAIESYPLRVNKAVYQEGQRRLAEILDVPLEWVIHRLHEQIPAFIEVFIKEHGRKPQIGEIIDKFNVLPGDVGYFLDRYLSTPQATEDMFLEELSSSRAIREALELVQLQKPQAAEVVRRCFGIDRDPQTEEEIARDLRVSSGRISQLKKVGLRLLTMRLWRRLR